ncbi:hypothetical protein CDD81_6027 [Ophiocordyceps australis]|uniref:Uncharacterized protein n=1 Tax=Ophiocordyceps australis TaxID=1399860 RepID=A0A2C5Y6U8_9HYPO|nr:hypothetical protein CDD81_6027 [Ophiocordyceps australis]
MHIFSILTAALATVASVTASTIGRRDAYTLISDFKTLADRTGDMSTALDEFTGSPPSIQPLEAATSSIITLFQQITANIDALPMLDPSQSRQILSALQNEAAIAQGFFNKLVAKHTLVAAIHQESIIVSVIHQFQDYSTRAFAVLTPKMNGLDSTLMGMAQATLEEALERALTTYM